MRIGDFGNLPATAKEAIRPAVQLIFPLVRQQLDRTSGAVDLRFTDPVGVAADGRAQECFLDEKVFDPAAAEQHLSPLAAQRNQTGQPGRPPVHHGQPDARIVAQNDQARRIAVGTLHAASHGQALLCMMLSGDGSVPPAPSTASSQSPSPGMTQAAGDASLVRRNSLGHVPTRLRNTREKYIWSS